MIKLIKNTSIIVIILILITLFPMIKNNYTLYNFANLNIPITENSSIIINKGYISSDPGSGGGCIYNRIIIIESADVRRQEQVDVARNFLLNDKTKSAKKSTKYGVKSSLNISFPYIIIHISDGAYSSLLDLRC